MRATTKLCLVLVFALASCQKVDPLFCGMNPTDPRCAALGDGGVGDSGGVTIGGTVDGLSGAGLVLQDNGGDDKTVTSPGRFNFPTQLAVGGGYDVTVKQQPSNPTQSCSVANGSGTATTDINNVAVTCTTPSFKVGVTVVGVSGTLVLTDNGGDDLIITASGMFKFATPLASGSQYNVAIKTNPGVCMIAGASGTVGSADVTSVVVNCTPNTYTIGGKVTNLNGTVKLHEATGNDDVTLTADGNFAFPIPVGQGLSYTVSVTQEPMYPPASQACSVSNGSGSGLGGNITAVVIDCVTNSFKVSGTATGVTGTIVLQNNGADNQTLTSSTGFAFPTKILSGTTYAVTVFQEPSNLGCSVSQGAGTIQNADVTNVSVACSYKDPGIKCGGAECTAGSEQCCDPEGGGPTCQASRSRCGAIVLGCDSAADCGGSVCCAFEDRHGNSQGSICTSNCFGRVATMCDPMAATPCPGGGTCKSYGALPGYYSCQ